jgi:hypothetical protein
MNTSKSWLLPVTGIVFIVFMIVGFTVGGSPPDATHSPDKIAQYYLDHKDKIQFSVLFLGVAMIFLLVFGSYLRAVLDRGEGESGVLPRVAFAGLVIFATGAAIDGTILIAISEAVKDIDPTGVQTLQALWDNDWVPLGLGVDLFILATGLSIVLHRSLPVWLGWLGLVIGVVGLTPVGFLAFPATGVWILIASVLLLISERSSAVPSAA